MQSRGEKICNSGSGSLAKGICPCFHAFILDYRLSILSTDSRPRMTLPWYRFFSIWYHCYEARFDLCYHLRLPDPLPFKNCEKQLILATQSKRSISRSRLTIFPEAGISAL